MSVRLRSQKPIVAIYLALFLISLLFNFGCVSPQGRQRLEELRGRMNEFQNSPSYFNEGRQEEFEHMRSELVDVLIDEGLQQEELIGIPGHEDAKNLALKYLQEALDLAQRPLSFTDKELTQKWNMMNWAWKDGLYEPKYSYPHYASTTEPTPRETWNLLKIVTPFIWPYTAMEQIVCFVGDLCGVGWEDDLNKIYIGSMGPEVVGVIKSHIERVRSTSLSDKRPMIARLENVLVQMEYVLNKPVRVLDAMELSLRHSPHMTDDKYKRIWDEKREEILRMKVTTSFQNGVIFPRSFLWPSKIEHKRLSETKLKLRIWTIGHIPYDQLPLAVEEMEIDQRGENDDELHYYLTPLDPTKSLTDQMKTNAPKNERE